MGVLGSGVISCGQDVALDAMRAPDGAAPRVESSPDLFQSEDTAACAVPGSPYEALLEEAPQAPLPAIPRRRPAMLTRARHEERGSSLPAIAPPAAKLEPQPRKEQPPAIDEPHDEPRVDGPPAIATPAALAPPGRDEPSRRPARPRSDLTLATNVSLAIGLGGVAMGAFAASGDSTPGERAMAISYASVGVAGFATAGVLYAITPAPDERIRLQLGPGMIGLRGSF